MPNSILWGMFPHSLGSLTLAAREGRVCFLGFRAASEAESALRADLPADTILRRDEAALVPLFRQVECAISGALPISAVPVELRGTPFQRRVWAAMAEIPYGETITYAQLAAQIGQPSAVRAVANACGANPVAPLIPCHRVVGSNGSLGGYSGGGVAVKQRLLDWEQKADAA